MGAVTGERPASRENNPKLNVTMAASNSAFSIINPSPNALIKNLNHEGHEEKLKNSEGEKKMPKMS
jgi:hypothetical protein